MLSKNIYTMHSINNIGNIDNIDNTDKRKEQQNDLQQAVDDISLQCSLERRTATGRFRESHNNWTERNKK